MNEPSGEKRAPAILGELKRLDETVTRLESTSEVTMNRIGRILTPNPPEPKKEPAGGIPGSQLTGELNGYSQRVQAVINRLTDANERIEL